MNISELPSNLKQLKASDWKSKPVKEEIRSNLLKALKNNQPLFSGIIGYENTVLPSLQIALLANHDILFLGEKGQAKSRLMRALIQFLDECIPFIDHPSIPVHEDPYHPITTAGKNFLAQHTDEQVPIGWWKREDRYAERLAPGTKFADIIGEIDPGKLVSGVSMATEDALHFGLIPRMHRGIFAMNEIPELDELVQVGLFNILEERDVQIRGYPVKFDLDIFVLFSANPSTYNRSGKVIPQLKDRIGSLIQTHYPLDRDGGIEIMEQESGNVEDKAFPVAVPRFMKEIVEQISRSARKSKFIDQQSGVSARFSIANYKTMIASARRRGVCLQEDSAVPRISDLSHLASSSLGKLELDLMGSHQMTEKQILDSLIADAVKMVFQEYVDASGLEEISQVFGKGVKIEVGDMLPSSHYAERIKVIPKAWEKTFEVNPSENDAVRASCIEFVLAGLHASDKISRSSKHGRISYELR
ncbi:MAG: magnesium chelatase [Gemmataceae bacterium]|jgi:magnesium chelatase subunit I